MRLAQGRVIARGMTNITREFESEISHAVSLIVAASRKVALAKLDEALGGDSLPGRRGARSASRVGMDSPGVSSRRRVEDLEALADRLMQEIWSSPGETTSVLAARMELSPRALRVPLKRLRSQGRIRTAGARQFTKYFPMPVPAGGK